MGLLNEKFARLGVDSAPGQEVRQQAVNLGLRGDIIDGIPVDFSHGDVDAFPPVTASLNTFVSGFEKGGKERRHSCHSKPGKQWLA